jgi:Domain of unknown function (DUF5063)
MPEKSQQDSIRHICSEYLALVTAPPLETRERHLRLAETFDRLCAAYNQSTEVEPDTEGVGEHREDYFERRKHVSAAFPELGYYPNVYPTEGFDQEIVTLGGHDDLSDIAIDLSEVVWLFDHNRPNDAIWQFRFGYENHWGHHLHDLRRYLHKLLYWG